VAGAARGVLEAAGFDVHLSPALDGGQYGWCVAVEEHPALIAYGACAMTPVASTPLAIWPLDAAVLLDAAHPGTSPAAIPGLEPVPGRRGYFNGPGDFKGELTATRVGDSWLVLAGGSGLAQRLEILRHLTATVKL
jgi:hypothetical protein